MKRIKLLLIISCILLFFIAGAVFLTRCSPDADSLADIRSDCSKLSLSERVDRLNVALKAAPKSDKRVIELLLTDAKYESEKRQIATLMFSLVQKRIQSVPSDEESVFTREALYYDALSILQTIPFGWLSSVDQENAVKLGKQIEVELSSIEKLDDSLLSLEVASAETNSTEIASTEPSPIEGAIAIINTALEEAKREDLSLIAQAQPNNVLSSALVKCDSARDMLMVQSPDLSDTSRSNWEAAMVHLGNAVTILKGRQRLKYTLWAEGRYRETNPTDPSAKLDEIKAMGLYKRLSEIDISLVAEPSLAKEITKRLYQLYDDISSLKGKERIRYDAIVSLEKRKTLDDF